MIMLVDTSAKKMSEIAKLCAETGIGYGHLRTPLTGYKKIDDIPVGIDNGCFGGSLDKRRFDKVIGDHWGDAQLKFVAMPDVVGSAQRTMELFNYFECEYRGLPLALVAQDGIESMTVKWDLISCIFIGGTDNFKQGKHAFDIAKTAKILGKWVHVGRVNTPERIRAWRGLADSFDGSGIARFDHMLKNAIGVLGNDDKQQELF